MTVNLTPASVFPANFRAPDDGDSANGALFQQCFQDAADAATNLQGRVDGHDVSIGNLESSRVVAGSALYSVSASSLGPLSPATLAEIDEDGGYVVASNEVTVPGPGAYFAALSLVMRHSSTVNPSRVLMAVMVGATPAFFADGARYSAAADNDVGCSGSGMIFITNPATEKITVQFVALGGTVSDGQVPAFSIRNRLSIVRVSA